MKRVLTRLLSRSVFASQLDALLLRHAAIVVAFHRIQDADDSDTLSVGPEMFERYCRFFRRHFHVVPLRKLVEALERRAPVGRKLAITFDDGYLDNFQNAAPILEQLSLPATFFVVSRFIGTTVVPWWDKERGVTHPWMNWDQVRSLHRRGFDIGAHTRTHLDLGTATGHDARHEIVGSRRELEAQLAAPVDLFAYPYGRPGNLAEANRALIREAGFRCCCSCFGGVVDQGTDPFHVARVPISSSCASPHHFGLQVALGRSVLSA
jgi:peptidoglycan/xylan/chitin deacetylase (PgdA/CDA1 family)